MRAALKWNALRAALCRGRAKRACEGLFVPINCAAIPASLLESELFGHVKGAFTGAHAERLGKFEIADGGTLFLDQVTEMAPELQAKLLRVLADNRIERIGSNRSFKIDLRILAATNRDPQPMVDAGVLRKDLFYRLNVLRVDVPPLRERREDIEPLARHFIARLARAAGRGEPDLEPAAVAKLTAYEWPGNVRELENVVERALVLAGGSDIVVSLLADLSIEDATPSAPRAQSDARDWSLQPQVEALERQLIEETLKITDDNKSKAARMLDISERSLWYKLKKYRLN